MLPGVPPTSLVLFDDVAKPKSVPSPKSSRLAKALLNRSLPGNCWVLKAMSLTPVTCEKDSRHGERPLHTSGCLGPAADGAATFDDLCTRLAGP